MEVPRDRRRGSGTKVYDENSSSNNSSENINNIDNISTEKPAEYNYDRPKDSVPRSVPTYNTVRTE